MFFVRLLFYLVLTAGQSMCYTPEHCLDCSHDVVYSKKLFSTRAVLARNGIHSFATNTSLCEKRARHDGTPPEKEEEEEEVRLKGRRRGREQTQTAQAIMHKYTRDRT